MKNLVTMIALTLGTNAFAISSIPVKVKNAFVPTYTLSLFTINEKSMLPKVDAIQSGTIELNQATRELKLVLGLGPVCNTAICSRLAIAPFQMTLPIVSRTFGSCGEKIIVAMQDLRTVDGSLTKVEIVDNQSNVCIQDALTVRAVDVTVTEVFSRTNDQINSTMTGFPIRN